MAYSTPFASAQLQEIPNETPLAETINFNGYTGWIVTNATPATFLLLDDNEIVQGKIDAWSKGQGSLPTSTTTITLQADYSWPVSNPEGVSATQFQLSLESTQSMLPPYSVTLAVANAIPSVIVNAAGETLVSIPSGSTIQITQAAGETLSINGDVTANIPAGASIEVTQAAGNALNIGSVQSIAETINANTLVQNETLTTNPIVSMGVASTTITNLAANTAINLNTASLLDVGQFDQVYVRINSQNGYAQDYTLTLQNLILDAYGLYSEYNLTIQGGSNTFPWGPRNTTIGITGPLTFNPQIFSNVSLSLTSSVAIASDVVTIEVYARYASQSIINPTSTPVYQQASIGKFGGATTYQGAIAANTAYTWAASGGFLTSLHLDIQNIGPGNTTEGFLYIYNGGVAIASAVIPTGSVSSQTTIDLRYVHGVPNNGITFEASTSAAFSGTIQVTGELETVQSTVQSSPATIG